MTEDVKRQMTAQDKIQDFARDHFPESHEITVGFYEAAAAAIMDFSDDYTVYVRYSAHKDQVIVTGATRGCIARPVDPHGEEHINFFFAPLNEQQQVEISDLLDDFIQAYENDFADQEADLCDNFEGLYDFIKDWQDRALTKMTDADTEE